MQIFTQIVLNQADIEEAIKAYVASQVGVPEGQSVDVALRAPETDRAEFTADVSISTNGSGQIQAKVSTNAAPKSRGKKAAAAAEQVAADVKEDETQVAETAAAAVEDGKDLPWNEETVAQQTIAEPQIQTETQQAQPNEVPATNALKIFPDANTSAPVMEKQPEPANNGKSLFANLIKPTNH